MMEGTEHDVKKKPNFSWAVISDAWSLMRPRKGILAVGLALIILNRLSGLLLPASTKYLLDNVILQHQVYLLTPLVLAVLASTMVQGLSSYILTRLMSKSAQRLIAELRLKVQAHIGRLPLAFYEATTSGAIVSRIMNDVEGVRNLLGTGLVEFVGGMLTAFMVLVYLFRTSIVMTAAACTGLIAFGIGLRQCFAFIRPVFRERPKLNAEVTGRLTESLSGVRVVKGYHAEEREAKVFQLGVDRLLENALQVLSATSLMSFSTTVLVGIISAVVLLLGTHEILIGKLTPGSFFSYTMFLGMLLAPVAQVVSIGPQITEALAGLERINQVLNEIPEDRNPARTIKLGRIEGWVEFDNVRFSYDSGKLVLQDISFKAKPSTVTALVGRSGAGKSTIISLIAAFHSPTTGRVLVDGVDLAVARLDSFRTQLGVVLQDNFLFDGTIQQNVAFGRPSATDEEIRAACLIARVDEFAELLEKKYETIVGERGIRLSGGQKQRISIARAILADPRILILDEATSSLDSESEAWIQGSLRYLMRGRTTFVIAHRLSTIQQADQILLLEGGCIVDRGTHESLYAANELYRDLYKRQDLIHANLFPAQSPSAEDTDGWRMGSVDSGREIEVEAGLSQAIRLLRGSQ